ncbi:MAG: endonuclease domain-containing protein [Planctomycetes bacterium]|nr:endonuclease domain-containing protein [Planctomycetota bacterium]
MNHHFARQLRKNMTDEERLLWRELRFRQLSRKFRRQAPIGNYIVDFVCFEVKLIIELDGSQHAGQVEDDSRRTEWLQTQGFRVLRFWNHQIREDIETVMEVIWKELQLTPHPDPPPQGGREKTGHS